MRRFVVVEIVLRVRQISRCFRVVASPLDTYLASFSS